MRRPKDYPPLRRATAAAAILLALTAASPWTNRQVAPPFKVKSVSGQKLDLDALRAKGPVLVDFWATWCKPCLAELPELEALHKEFGPRGLTVVGVSIDGPRNFAKVRPFAARLGLTFPIVLDEDGGLQQRYRVVAAPTAVLVDTAGTIVKVSQGYRPGGVQELAAAIRALLPGEPGTAPASPPAQPAGADSASAPAP